MKRRDLERALRQLGWQFLRHGGKHDVWTDGKREEAIPRHTEIHDKLAQAILRRAKGSSLNLCDCTDVSIKTASFGSRKCLCSTP